MAWIHSPDNNPPALPIVTGTNSGFKPLAVVLDLMLQPKVIALLTFLQGTMDFLNYLCKVSTLPADCILCTMYVSSVYISIPYCDWVNHDV